MPLGALTLRSVLKSVKKKAGKKKQHTVAHRGGKMAYRRAVQ